MVLCGCCQLSSFPLSVWHPQWPGPLSLSRPAQVMVVLCCPYWRCPDPWLGVYCPVVSSGPGDGGARTALIPRGEMWVRGGAGCQEPAMVGVTWSRRGINMGKRGKRQRRKGGGEREVGKDGTWFPAIALQRWWHRRDLSPRGAVPPCSRHTWLGSGMLSNARPWLQEPQGRRYLLIYNLVLQQCCSRERTTGWSWAHSVGWGSRTRTAERKRRDGK